jgi:pimeloyl-ACP methyl ester carboxylesterase
MAEVKKNAVFLHVCVPGQEDNAPDYVDNFPTLAQMGEDLACVLEKIDVKSCIAFGEGAGANIICRFALLYPNKISGIILVHCTSTTVGVLEYFRDKVIY